MKRKLSLLLNDIIECIDKINEYVINITQEKFYKDIKTQDAIIRRLEIIGEAVKNIPGYFKDKNSDIPWRDISDMRNLMIHNYPGVRLRIIWEVIKDNLPELKEKIIPLYKEELKQEKE